MKNTSRGGKSRSGKPSDKRGGKSEKFSGDKKERNYSGGSSEDRKFSKSRSDKPGFKSGGDFSDKKRKFSRDDDFKPRKNYGDKREDDGGFKKKRFDSDSEFKPRKSYGDKKDDDGGFKKKSLGGDRDFKPRKRFDDKKDDGGFKKKRFDSDSEFKPRKSYGNKREDDGGFKKKRFDSDSEFKPRKSYGDKSEDDGGFKKKRFDGDRDFKPRKNFDDKKDDGYKKKRFDSDSEFKPRKSYGDKKEDDGGFKKKSFGGERDFKPRKSFGDKKESGYVKKDFSDKKSTDSKFTSAKKKFNPNDDLEDEPTFSFEKFDSDKKRFTTEKKKYQSLEKKSSGKKSFATPREDDGTVRLNKFLSNAGICSRREADMLIESGVIKVNGKVVTELGTRIHPEDKVSYGDQTVKSETLVYLLLNKPKDYITTVDDPNKRRTVMELIKGACKERIYPVGRLDRNTTGLLLFTNDGELTMKLTHPKNGIKKVYHVVTDQNVTKEDMEQLRNGIELEDGFIMPDDVDFVGEGHNKKDIGIEIHSGKNRVVRRMFEHLGYKVVKLDRVMFAGLTKKDLPRGKYRMLSKQEISFLKMG